MRKNLKGAAEKRDLNGGAILLDGKSDSLTAESMFQGKGD
jgi:formylmethanofuran dehydrogenase subunit C